MNKNGKLRKKQIKNRLKRKIDKKNQFKKNLQLLYKNIFIDNINR